jgi:C-terminal processing protease CtpA/Prc
VEILEGNLGYVDMRSFDGHVEAKPTAAAAMNFVGNADAVIFDMRNNGGGSPDMVRYVSSWFFSAATHLNSLYVRDGDQTIEFWTIEEIPGEKRPDVPLFVLTSERTFSGAEEFTYNMLTQGRATVIGEVSGGGANPGGTVWIDDQFEIFIPQGAAINPITGTNWEGVGVTPDVQATAEQALDVAIGMARTAIQGSRGNNVP